MQKYYKNKFTEEELNKLNKISKDKIRYSTMEVYSHLAKRINESGTNKLILSLRDFLKRFNRYGNTLAVDTLNKRLELLKEIGLIVIEKVKKTKVYSLIVNCVAEKKSDNFSDNNKVPSSLENTELEGNLEKHKEESSLFNIELEPTTKVQKFDYETFIKNSPKATTEQIATAAHEMFRTMKVKSYKVKSKVMQNLMEYAGKITVQGLEKYIEMAIKQKQNYDRECYKRNVLGIGRKQHTHQNFEGRGAEYYVEQAEMLVNNY